MSILRDVANAAEMGNMAMLQKEQMAGLSRPSTLTENLEARKASLEQQLARVNTALDALKANPAFEEVINLLSQV